MIPVSDGLLKSVEIVISPQIKFKKKWLDNKGVSEIIGTILMLAITVVLFSSIMVFVTNMPTPTERPTADFLSELTVSTDPLGQSNLTLTHNGGEALNDYETAILIVIDGNAKYIPLTGYFTDEKWSIGESWAFNEFHAYPLFGSNTSLEAMVLDTASNSQIWDSKISASSGNNAPVILQRWADADASTLTPDPIRESDTGFTIYVRAFDPDIPSDLPSTGVWIDATSISGSNHVTGPTSGGVWGFAFSGIAKGTASAYDGRPLFIHAKDLADHETIETFVLDVLQPDVHTTNVTEYNNGSELGDSGLPLWLKYVNEDQGYVILGEDESKRNTSGWGAKADVNDPKTTFTSGEEWVFIRVGSLRLKSIQGINNLSVVSRLSGVAVTPPSNSSGFYKINEVGNAFIYEAKFNSSLLSPGGYDVIINLQSTGTEGESPVRFYAKSNLSIYPQAGQLSVFIPSIEVYDKDRRTDLSAQLWGTFEKPYDLSTASASSIWVEVHMQSITPLAAGASIYEVRISDMRGRTNLFGDVPSGSMISSLSADPVLTKVYYFKIDLKLRNGVSWGTGLSAYSLTLTRVMDADEGVYTISAPVFIKSALHTKNFVIGTTGFGSAGNANFDHFDYLYQVENNKFFTAHILDGKDESPGSGGDASKIIKRVLYFDMDEDGDRDVLAGVYDGLQWRLVMYTNRLNVIGTWEVGTTLASYGATAVLSMAYGDVDADGDYDWAVCLANGEVYLYINDYPIETTTPFVTGVNPKYFTEMRLVDVTGDEKADLIGIGSATALANRGAAGSRLYIYDFWVNDVFTLPPKDLVDYPIDGSIYDFDIADIDRANGPDIAVCSAAAVGGYGIRWYERDVTQSIAVATNDPAPGTYIGNVTGTFTNTQTSNDVYESITELGGDLEYIWPVGVVSGKSPTLHLEAKVASGADEGFYFYYSRDVSVPIPIWTFMFAVSSTATTDTTYSFPLPANVAGTIYVKVIDASTSGAHDDTISVDRLYVSGISAVKYNTKTHGLAADTNYIRIGIGNFNGGGNLDIAVGKGSAGVGGAFKVIDGSTGLVIANPAYVNLSPGGSLVDDPNGDAFSTADVNGDGLADIVSAVYSTTLPDVSILSMWLNLGDGTTYSYIQIIDCSLYTGTGGKPTGDDRNIYNIAVEEPYG